MVAKFFSVLPWFVFCKVFLQTFSVSNVIPNHV